MLPQMRQFLDFDAGSNPAVLVNNFDWIGPFSYLEFLRDVGKHFPGQRDARQGLGERPARPRRRRHELHRVQLHAAAGVRLRPSLRQVRLRAASRRQRSVGQHHGRHRPGPAHARRAALRPHLPAADEARRHEDGQDRVAAPSGCRPKRTSPYQFYQYWINVDDADVGKCLRMLTDAAARRNRIARRGPRRRRRPSATASAAWPRS